MVFLVLVVILLSVRHSGQDYCGVVSHLERTEHTAILASDDLNLIGTLAEVSSLFKCPRTKS